MLWKVVSDEGLVCLPPDFAAGKICDDVFPRAPEAWLTKPYILAPKLLAEIGEQATVYESRRAKPAASLSAGRVFLVKI
jgi:hypothetical protein